MESLQKSVVSKPVRWPVILAFIACASVLLNLMQFVGSLKERPRKDYFNEYFDERDAKDRLALENARLEVRSSDLQSQLSELTSLSGQRRYEEEFSRCLLHFGGPLTPMPQYERCQLESGWYRAHPFDPQGVLRRIIVTIPEH